MSKQPAITVQNQLLRLNAFCHDPLSYGQYPCVSCSEHPYALGDAITHGEEFTLQCILQYAG